MTLADHISAEATLAYSLIVPAVGTLAGLIIALAIERLRKGGRQ